MHYELALVVGFFFMAWVIALKLRIAELERRLEGKEEAKPEPKANTTPRQSGVPTWHID